MPKVIQPTSPEGRISTQVGSQSPSALHGSFYCWYGRFWSTRWFQTCPLPSPTAAPDSFLRGICFQHPASWASPFHQTMTQSLTWTDPACSVTHLLACFSPGLCPAWWELLETPRPPTSLGPFTSSFCCSGVGHVFIPDSFFPPLIFQNRHFNLGFYQDMMKFQTCSQLHPRFQGALV